MSIFVELAGFLAGSLTEYSRQMRWGACRIFATMFSAFFSLFMVYVVLFPSSKGIWTGMGYAAVIGCGMGVVGVLAKYFQERHERARPKSCP